MRTTIDLPEALLSQAMAASGAKTKRDAVRWALEEALRRSAINGLLENKMRIELAISPAELEAREVQAQYRKSRRQGHR